MQVLVMAEQGFYPILSRLLRVMPSGALTKELCSLAHVGPAGEVQKVSISRDMDFNRLMLLSGTLLLSADINLPQSGSSH